MKDFNMKSQSMFDVYTGPFYNWFYIIALFFLNFLTFHFAESYWMSLSVFLAIVIISLKTGSEVNLTEKTHRNYIEVPRVYRWGKWLPIAQPESILISKTMANTQLFNFFGSNTLCYDVNIITTHGRDPLISRCVERNEALSYAKFAAKYYGINIQERISNGYVWLTEEDLHSNLV